MCLCMNCVEHPILTFIQLPIENLYTNRTILYTAYNIGIKKGNTYAASTEK